MANLCSATGTNNFSATAWLNFDTTSASIAGSTSATVTTGNLRSAAFTPGAVGTTDGVLLNVSFRIASPTGTFKVSLTTSVGDTEVAAVTVNVADLNMNGYTAATAPGSWHFFKWATPFVLVAAVAYKITVTSSSSSQIGLYGGASNDWNRLLRLTTAASAAAAGDRLFIQSELTGAGASTTCTVTMDINAATSYGKIDVSKGGVLIFNTAAATQLRTAGVLDVWPGGTLQQGTSGTPIPAGTQSLLEFDCASAVQYGLRIMNGTWDMYGGSKTKSWSLLAANAAASATALTLNDNVGTAWKNGDTLVLSPTTRTSTEGETKALGADSNGTSIPTIAALTNAHGGDASTKVQGEVGNLDRWAALRAVTAANSTYIFVDTLAIVNLSWAQIKNIGSATANKRGIDILTTTGTFSVAHCALWNSTVPASSIAFNINTASGSPSVDDCVVYGFASNAFLLAGATSGTPVITNNMLTGNSTSQPASHIDTSDNGITLTGNRISSGANGITAQEQTATFGTWSNNSCHSINGHGLGFGGQNIAGTISTFTSWRNTSYGFRITATSSNSRGSLIFDTPEFFGNATAGMGIPSTWIGSMRVNSGTFNAGVTLTQPLGLQLAINGGGFFGDVRFNSCNFGVTQTHATADIGFSAITSMGVQIYLYNCTLASGTEVGSQTIMAMAQDMGIFSSRHDGSAGTYKSWFTFGSIQSDTTSLGFVSGVSEKMTPNNATNKLISAFKEVYLNSGQTATVSVTINKNAAYSGNQPRLMVRENYSAGINSDTALATYSAGTGSANVISGTTAAVTENCTLQFYVDCDGTAGFINATDWLVTIA